MGNSLWQRNYDSIAAVSQLIEIGGKRHDRQVAGRAGVLGAKARFYDAKRTLDQGVTKAYIAALLAGENARVLTESANYMREEAKIAQAQFQAGDISEADKKTLEIMPINLKCKPGRPRPQRSRRGWPWKFCWVRINRKVTGDRRTPWKN